MASTLASLGASVQAVWGDGGAYLLESGRA